MMSDPEDELPLSVLSKRKMPDSDDDVPLSELVGVPRAKLCTESNIKIGSSSDDSDASDADYDSDKDPAFTPGKCEVRGCKEEVFAACPECEILLCYNHISEDVTSCRKHGYSTQKKNGLHGKGKSKQRLQPLLNMKLIPHDLEQFLHAEQPPIHAEKPPIHAEQPPIHAEKSPIHAEQPPIHAEKSPIHAEQPPIHAEKSPIHAEQPPIHAEKSPIHAEQPPIHAEQPQFHAQQPIFHAEQQLIHAEQPPNQAEQPPNHAQQSPINAEQPLIHAQQETSHQSMPFLLPEDYTVEGSEREVVRVKRSKQNKQKVAKRKRNLGQEYTSPATKKRVCQREMKPRCKHSGDGKAGDVRRCSEVSDEQREASFKEYYEMGDLTQQREFVVRHIKRGPKIQKTTGDKESRREKTNEYFLTVNNEMVPVCKLLFLSTLSVSEQFTRTALKKLTPAGTVEKEKRGGLQSESVKARNLSIREAVSKHIDKFPRVESHYCRESTTREYLSEDLTKKKMYHMFLSEWGTKPEPPTLKFYKSVFKEKNLSIHKPKKDQCSLCKAYRSGDLEMKDKLQLEYGRHIEEKERVRKIKDEAKAAAKTDNTILCANFDLQQVIYLPISNEGALFYKRRLSNYNLTFYNLASKKCHCYTWNETTSKRGASEISMAVFKALQHYDALGVKKAYLFSDGCSGQNKNSMIPAMMLYMLSHSQNLEEIALHYFVTNHGQSEGDSAHSSITTALKGAGDVFLPSQLMTIFALARADDPYIVEPLEWDDFLDFNTLARDLRILDARKGTQAEKMAWNEIMEIRVSKQHPDTIFLKTSHSDSEYTPVPLKRLKQGIRDHTVKQLNTGPNSISTEKYSDLIQLCSGRTPVIRLSEHINFYRSLPHN